MQTKTTRQAKVHGLYRPATTRWGSGNRGKYVPWLNVNGLWLEQAGFKVGDRIEISVKNKELTIKKLPAHGNRCH
jgi:HSP20-like domain of unknown function (DUF1813).